MKNLIIIVFVAMTQSLIAQNSKLIQAVTFGGIASTVASTNLSDASKPFTMGGNLFATGAIVTKKSFHAVAYGFSNNSINTFDGYFLKNNWDVYAVYSKSLSTRNQYLGIGIEKMEKIGGVKFFGICELGTTFNGNPILSFGMLTNVSWSLKR